MSSISRWPARDGNRASQRHGQSQGADGGERPSSECQTSNDCLLRSRIRRRHLAKPNRVCAGKPRQDDRHQDRDQQGAGRQMAPARWRRKSMPPDDGQLLSGWPRLSRVFLFFWCDSAQNAIFTTTTAIKTGHGTSSSTAGARPPPLGDKEKYSKDVDGSSHKWRLPTSEAARAFRVFQRFSTRDATKRKNISGYVTGAHGARLPLNRQGLTRASAPAACGRLATVSFHNASSEFWGRRPYV